MTALGLTNYILQLFFVRLTKHQEARIKSFRLRSFSLSGCSGDVTDSETVQWYSIMYFVVPFTGWINDFKFIGKQRFIRITKDKIIK